MCVLRECRWAGSGPAGYISTKEEVSSPRKSLNIPDALDTKSAMDALSPDRRLEEWVCMGAMFKLPRWVHNDVLAPWHDLSRGSC